MKASFHPVRQEGRSFAAFLWPLIIFLALFMPDLYFRSAY